MTASSTKYSTLLVLGVTLVALLLLSPSMSAVVAAQDSSSSGSGNSGGNNSGNNSNGVGCILPFDVDDVPALAGGLVTAADGTKQELTLADSSSGKLVLSGRLALALPPSSSSSSSSPCPSDGKGLLDALPGAKLVAVDGVTGLKISPNPVKAKVRLF